MTTSRAPRLLRLAPLLLLLLVPLQLAGQQGASSTPGAWADEVLKRDDYQQPPKELADAVLAPRHLNVTLDNLSPDKKWFLEETPEGPVEMRTFSKPFHELGGLFIDFKANRARPLTVRNNVALQLISATDGAKRTIQIPAGARVTNATWSPEGSTIAFFVHSDDATQIWVADPATGKAHALTKTPVLATLVTTFDFTADGKQIAFVQIPDGRAPIPVAPVSPTGPTVKLADAGKNRLRTFPSLMATPYEKTLLEWHTTGQLALIDVQKGTVHKVGQPAMIRALDVSPDGRFVRVTRMVTPFSYDVPVASFGSVEEIWDAGGTVLAKVNDRPIDLGVQDDNAPQDPPAGGGRGQNAQGKRELAWRPDGHGLTYLEQDPAPAADAAADGRGRGARGGDTQDTADDGARGGRTPPRKDHLYQWLPPFDDASRKVLLESNSRMTGARFSPDMQLVFFSERAGQNTTEYAVDLADTAKRYTLARYRADDVYANPGTLLSTRTSRGAAPAGGGRGGGGSGGPVQLSADKQSAFFQGTAYDKNPSEVGPKSFIDKVNIRTGEKQRVYESDNRGLYERVSSVIDLDSGRFIVSRESPTDVPQQYLVQGAARTQLTHNRDLMPDLTRAKRERLTVERADGFRFKVDVTLPESWQAGTKLPAIFWFYPREFQGQEEYDRPERTFNRNEFKTFGTRSVEFFVRLGYAVVQPDAPIVGPQGQMNNNYVNDLRNDLAATIDELDRRGMADRTRLAIGGHSYGAFSAVNAMVHTPFFKAGIAGDGAYNRTLTPIGFQNERRDLWEARDVYLSMSPFLYANNLTGALLMYHNLGDQNVGTDPTNSIRLYHALNGLGKTTALYLYPYEDHGPVARETLLDLWARWAAWLDKYVKNPEKKGDRRSSSTDQPGRQ